MTKGSSTAHSIAEIARALGAEVMGDGSVTVSAAAEPAMAGPGDLALASTPAYAEKLSEGQARAALLWPGADWQELGLEAAIAAPRPRFAMAGLSRLFDPGYGFGPGIHETALIDPSATLGEGVCVGPYTIIGPGVEIGAGCVIGPQCHIGLNSRIGPDGLLRDGVRIGPGATIGARVIIQPGAIIGGDGFSFVTPETSAVEMARGSLGAEAGQAQDWARIHSLGSVTVGDDVEIGAAACIDRGTIRDTVIGDGCKLDNLVHIGHNVRVGRNGLLCAQTGIAGSTVIGDNVVLGGQTGVSDNIFIGDNVIAGGASKIFTNVPSGRVVLGSPAVKMETHVESYKALRRLPRLFRDVRALQKAVSKTSESD